MLGLYVSDHPLLGAERALRRKTHDTIRRVTIDIEERMHLNTAVSSLMELVNELYAFSESTPPAGTGQVLVMISSLGLACPGRAMRRSGRSRWDS